MNFSDIKPCPRCGNEMKSHTFVTEYDLVALQCNECGFKGELRESYEEAILKWNNNDGIFVLHCDLSDEALLRRRKIAEKATPGPWRSGESEVCLAYTPDHNRTDGYGCNNDFVCDLNDGEYHEYQNKDEQIANAAHIAANDPQTVMAFIDEIMWLRAENRRLSQRMAGHE